MKRITTVLLTFAIVAFVCSSCKKDGIFNPTKKITSRTIESFYSSGEQWSQVTEVYEWDNDLLVKETVNDNGDVYYMNFSYDNRNRLVEVNVDNGISLKYYYNENKLQSFKTYMDGELQCTWNIVYDSHAISEIDVKWTEAGALNRKKLTVNPLFFMSKEIANMVGDRKNVKEGEYEETYLFTYKNGDYNNVAQCKMNFQGSEYVVDYKYDKKNNPLCGNFGLIDFDFTRIISRNNIVESVSSSVNQGPAVLKYEYTYLEDYPLTEISKNEAGKILEKTTYTYAQ